MSFERSPPAIDLIIGRSPILAATFAGAYGLAIAAVLLSGLPWPLRAFAVAGLVAFAGWWIAERALVLGRWSIVRFIWRPEGECEYRDRGGRYRRCELMPGMLVTPLLVVVRLRRGRLGLRTLCIARDAVDAEAFRVFRMRLTISPPGSPPALFRRIYRRWKMRLGNSRTVRLS